MNDTQKRIDNPETLLRLGRQLRQQREQARLSQSKVSRMRQATISKIENGGDVTLDTFVSYAAALGLEVALVPIGQARGLAERAPPASAPLTKPLDLLSEFADLQDDSP